MTEIEKREKVLRGLSAHVYGHPHTRCHKCPYWGTGPHESSECNQLAADALALLRARAARLMTLEEVKAIEAGKLVWIEISGGYDGTRYKAVPAIISQIFNDAVYFYNTSGRTLHSYNRDVMGWRLWTDEPTDTQRLKEKWNIS